MRRARWWVCLPALALLCTSPANAGTITFTSPRCADEADRQTRPDMYFPPAKPACATAIWLVEDDGTGLRRITTPKPYKGHASPAWSPDGTRIAYTGEGAVWVALADGSNPQRITEGEAAAWSPDGLSIVVSRDTTTSGPLGETIPGSRDLFAVALNGLATRRLTATPEDEIHPRLSNDGTKVVFTRQVNGYQYMRYWKPGEPPTLPPEILAREGLFSLSLGDGWEARLLSTDIPLNTQFGARFSPDGKRLAFTTDWSIHTMNADGSELRRRTAPLTGFQPVWSGADSLLFIQRDDRRSGLVELDLASSKLRAVLPMEEHGPQAADWTPPGGLAALDPPVDIAAPGVGLFDVRARRRVGSRKQPRASAASTRGVRRKDLSYMAADVSGLRVVRVAFGRRNRKRCRFLGRRSYSRPRSCRRPLYRKVGSPGAWKAITARLRPGVHVLYVRTKDARGNRTRRARRVYLTIRR